MVRPAIPFWEVDEATFVNGQIVLFGQVFHPALAYLALDLVLVIQVVTDSVVYPGRVQMRVAFQDFVNGIAGLIEASNQGHGDPCPANSLPDMWRETRFFCRPNQANDCSLDVLECQTTLYQAKNLVSDCHVG